MRSRWTRVSDRELPRAEPTSMYIPYVVCWCIFSALLGTGITSIGFVIRQNRQETIIECHTFLATSEWTAWRNDSNYLFVIDVEAEKIYLGDAAHTHKCYEHWSAVYAHVSHETSRRLQTYMRDFAVGIRDALEHGKIMPFVHNEIKTGSYAIHHYVDARCPFDNHCDCVNPGSNCLWFDKACKDGDQPIGGPGCIYGGDFVLTTAIAQCQCTHPRCQGSSVCSLPCKNRNTGLKRPTFLFYGFRCVVPSEKSANDYKPDCIIEPSARAYFSPISATLVQPHLDAPYYWVCNKAYFPPPPPPRPLDSG